MKSLREIILGETKLQKILQENREHEPILQKGNYYEILAQLDETNELSKSDTRVSNRWKYIIIGGSFLCASEIMTDLLIKQEDPKTILGLIAIGTGLIAAISMGVSYDFYREERNNDDCTS